MQNNEYLSEEKYQQTNVKVKKIGKILLIVGIIVLILSFILTIIGLLSFGNSALNIFDIYKSGNEIDAMKNTASGTFGSFGVLALSGSLGTIGFILTATGAIIMAISHKREITAYTTQQVMPIAQEGIEKITPTVATSIGEIAKSISKGIQDGKQNPENNQNKDDLN